MLRLLAFICLLPMPLFAQCVGPSFLDDLSGDDRARLLERAAETPYGTGLNWTAEKDGTHLTIVGTLHLPDPRHDAIRRDLLGPLEQADLLLVEATLEDQRALQLYMAENTDLMTITDGPTLPERLDTDTWNAIRVAAADRSIPGFMAAKMQPWFLGMSLAMPPCSVMALARGDGGLDSLLMQDAAAFGVPTAPLEPWQDTFALLTKGTFDEQVDALRMAVIDGDTHNAIIVAMSDLYFAEQTAQIWHLSDFMKSVLPNMDPDTFDAQMAIMEQELLIRRNINWIPVIERAAQRHDRIFIAFGAAHLIGDQGVLALLKANGWDISER